MVGDDRRRDVFDVAVAGIEGFDLGRINVQTEDVDAGAGELDGERETDVTETDDGDVHKSVFFRNVLVKFHWFV